MLVYCIIMFLAAAVFAALSIAVYRGRTDLIHDYHQTKVRDKAAYGRAFGKALGVFPLAMLLSGILGLVADTKALRTSAVTVLIAGLCVGVSCLIAVQKKYNSGVF